MSEFAKLLRNCVDRSVQGKDERVRSFMERGNMSVEEALAYDSLIVTTNVAVLAAVGEQLDSVTPQMRQYALRGLLGSLSINLMDAQEMIIAIMAGVPFELIGQSPIDPGCDCQSCKMKREMTKAVRQTMGEE